MIAITPVEQLVRVYVLSRLKESRVSYVMDVEVVVWEVEGEQLRVCVCMVCVAEIE